MKKIIAFVAVSSMLAACGTVGNSVISDKNLQQKSSIALNTNPENITISNRRSDGLDSVRFTATANNRLGFFYPLPLQTIKQAEQTK